MHRKDPQNPATKRGQKAEFRIGVVPQDLHKEAQKQRIVFSISYEDQAFNAAVLTPLMRTRAPFADEQQAQDVDLADAAGVRCEIVDQGQKHPQITRGSQVKVLYKLSVDDKVVVRSTVSRMLLYLCRLGFTIGDGSFCMKDVDHILEGGTPGQCRRIFISPDVARRTTASRAWNIEENSAIILESYWCGGIEHMMDINERGAPLTERVVVGVEVQDDDRQFALVPKPRLHRSPELLAAIADQSQTETRNRIGDLAVLPGVRCESCEEHRLQPKASTYNATIPSASMHEQGAREARPALPQLRPRDGIDTPTCAGAHSREPMSNRARSRELTVCKTPSSNQAGAP
ncbi:hypothetical protein HDZ31DRAFT_76010 [Schizophyllum fasciatum]